MKNKSLINVTLVLVASTLWLVWFSLHFTQSHIDLWQESARDELIALKERVEITPGRNIIKYFQVHYDAPHFVGLTFDDQALSDSLEKYIGWFNHPDFGLKLSWTLYDKQDSLTHHSMNYSTGSSGNTFMFNEFAAQTGKRYKIDFLLLTLPKFVKADSAWLEIGVSQAQISVGNEYFYGILDGIVKYLSTPALWSAIIVTAFTLFSFLQKRMRNKNSN